jgi:hypothetical protein
VRGWNEQSTSAISRQRSSLGPGSGLLMQFQSPYQSGRSVILLTATLNEDLESVSRAILDSTVQSQAHGDLVHIEPGKEIRVTSMSAGPRYVTGKTGSYSPVESFLYTRPVLYYAAAGLAVLALAIIGFLGLRRWRAKRREGPPAG